jgi:hypothetical protein
LSEAERLNDYEEREQEGETGEVLQDLLPFAVPMRSHRAVEIIQHASLLVPVRSGRNAG